MFFKINTYLELFSKNYMHKYLDWPLKKEGIITYIPSWFKAFSKLVILYLIKYISEFF